VDIQIVYCTSPTTGQYAWPFGTFDMPCFCWTGIHAFCFSVFENNDDAAEAYSRWDARATRFADNES
jgi:hypothetical protein